MTLLDYGDSVTVLLAWVAIASGMAVALIYAGGEWPRDGRHVADRDPIPPARSMARRTGEGDATRPAGPGGAPDTIAIGPITPRPYVLDPDVTRPVPTLPGTVILPPLVVDSPPGALGTLPTIGLGVPIVRLWSCGLCRDGRDVIGRTCIWCDLPNPRTEVQS